MRIVFDTWIEPWRLIPFTSINGVVIAIHHLRLHDLLRDYFIPSVNISDPQFVETINLIALSQFNREHIFSIGFMIRGKEGLYNIPQLGLLRLLYTLNQRPYVPSTARQWLERVIKVHESIRNSNQVPIHFSKSVIKVFM